jgi:predicted dithiol-disulfide oxidoreductase (DUF899 family)
LRRLAELDAEMAQLALERARQRRELPRVAIEKEHRVDADAGRGPRHPAGVCTSVLARNQVPYWR